VLPLEIGLNSATSVPVRGSPRTPTIPGRNP